MTESIRVVYLQTDEPSLEAKGLAGRLSLHADSLTIVRDTGLTIPLASVQGVELVRSQLGHLVRVRHAEGTLWLGAYRLNLWGRLVILNKAANRRLAQRIKGLVS